MFYCMSIASVKLSILLLITRIFLAVNRNVLFWLTHLLMWTNTLFYSIAFFLAIFACRPRHKIWSPEVPGQCFDSKSLYITSATFNTVSDLLVLSVPIHMIWKLQMGTKRKLGVSAIFGTGALYVARMMKHRLCISRSKCANIDESAVHASAPSCASSSNSSLSNHPTSHTSTWKQDS